MSFGDSQTLSSTTLGPWDTYILKPPYLIKKSGRNKWTIKCKVPSSMPGATEILLLMVLSFPLCFSFPKILVLTSLELWPRAREHYFLELIFSWFLLTFLVVKSNTFHGVYVWPQKSLSSHHWLEMVQEIESRTLVPVMWEMLCTHLLIISS